MNRAGGVGVYVRQLAIKALWSITCAEELGSFLHPLSHIPPPRFGYFCAKSNKRKFSLNKRMVGPTLRLGTLRLLPSKHPIRLLAAG